MNIVETFLETITGLRHSDDSHNFNLHMKWIACVPLNLPLKPTEFQADDVHRFEGMNNPDDSFILFAIHSLNGVVGIVVDADAAYHESLSSEMIKRLTINGTTSRG